jgi:hypothetical protein
MYVYVNATASSVGGSTIVVSLKLQPGAKKAYSMYTINLNVN